MIYMAFWTFELAQNGQISEGTRVHITLQHISHLSL